MSKEQILAKLQEVMAKAQDRMIDVTPEEEAVGQIDHDNLGPDREKGE